MNTAIRVINLLIVLILFVLFIGFPIAHETVDYSPLRIVYEVVRHPSRDLYFSVFAVLPFVAFLASGLSYLAYMLENKYEDLLVAFYTIIASVVSFAVWLLFFYLLGGLSITNFFFVFLGLQPILVVTIAIQNRIKKKSISGLMEPSATSHKVETKSKANSITIQQILANVLRGIWGAIILVFVVAFIIDWLKNPR